MTVYTGVAGAGVELGVEVAAGKTVEVAGLKVHQHAAREGPVRLFDRLVRQDAAGVRTGAGDEADEPVTALFGGVGRAGEQHGGRVVEQDEALAGNAAPFQFGGKVGADEAALKAGELHLLCEAQDAPVALGSLLSGIGEAEAHLVGPVEQRGKPVRDKADKILPGDGSVRAGHGADAERVDDRPVLGKADERGAEVGAARVNDCGGLAERELPVGGEIGGDHPDGAFPAAQTELHVAYKSGGGRVEVYTLRLHAVASEENADLF